MASIEINKSYPPILFVTMDGVASDEEFDDYLDELDKASVYPGAHFRAVLIDARTAGRATATQRQRQAEMMKKNKNEVENGLVALGFVINNPAVRGAVTAVFWIQRMPAPFKVCATISQAVEFVCGRLKEEGLPVPNLSTLNVA
jgi:hypothetical protein